MRNHWLYTLHKFLALSFSLPLLLLALSGVFIALTPLLQSEVPTQPLSVALGDLMLQVKTAHPEAQLLRGLSKGPGGETAHLLVSTPASSRVMMWLTEQGVQQKNMRRDFVYQNKHFHEGFLIPGVGKKLVALSGAGLLLVILSGCFFWCRAGRWSRTRGLRRSAPRRLASWHVLLGFALALPLGFQAITGSLIELHGQFFSDAPVLPHEVPTECTFEQQQSLVVRLNPSLIFFCRPDFPYLVARGSAGIQQYTPQGELVLQLGADDWQGHALSRKGFFVGWHEAKIFGKGHYFYNFIIASALLFFIISGLTLGWRKRALRAST